MFEYRRHSRVPRRALVLLGLVSTAVFLHDTPAATAAEPPETRARQILDTAEVPGGLIVHVGCGNGILTTALHANDACLVLGLNRDAAEVDAARQRVLRAGLSGKISVHLWSGQQLPLVDNVARLIVVEEPTAVSSDELVRSLCPGGVALVNRNGTWEKTVKPWPDEIDQWTHYLRGADGNAVAEDTRVGPPRHMQWLCGPRWMRNHHLLASISAIVSEGGRIFYILDEGPSANLDVPGQWIVLARDAFSGVSLWRRPIESWAHWQHRFRSGPGQLARLLVAGPGRIYVPLGVNAPLTALDAASGDVIRTYQQTEGAEEMLLDGDALLVVAASPLTAQQTAGAGKPKSSPKNALGRRGTPYVRTLMAIDTESGKPLWKWSSDEGNPEPMALATDGKRVCFQFGKGVVCLDRQTGNELWRTPDAKNARKAPILMSDSTMVLTDEVVLWTDSKTVWALAAEDGRQLWSCQTNPSLTASKGKIIETRAGFRGPADLFVVDGLVWVGAQFAEGRDLKTGEVRKTTMSAATLQTAGHHHRCYREKATSRYILIGQRGTEFIDLLGDNHSRNNWVRGVCQYGVLPCNGLLYTPPHACGCYMESKLSGFWAMSAQRETPPAAFESERLLKGPAYGAAGSGSVQDRADWPTFRHDPIRCGSTMDTLPEELRTAWTTQIGGRLTAPVCAEGVVLAASMETNQVVALDAGSGARRWAFTAGGPIDSPPTIFRGMALFGCSDGSVYCLRLSDGELVWRFFAAPEERFAVAMDHIESVWPVHGSVLVEKGVAYFSAGRSSYLDGGIVLYGLEPATGKVLCQTTLCSEHPEGRGSTPDQDATTPEQPFVQNATDARTFLAPDQSDAFSMAGATSDVMVSNGHSIFLRHLPFDRKLTQQETKARHLFSTSRLVDDTENHRIHWVLGTGDFSRIGVAYSWQVNLLRARKTYAYKPNVPFAMLLAFDEKAVWGVRRPEGYKGYELTAWHNTPFAADEKHVPDIRKMRAGEDADTGETWTTTWDMRPRSLVHAGEVLILGGGPYVVAPRDPAAAYEGRTGGLIRTVRAEDGEFIAQYELNSPVVWNGLAVAGNRLYAATMDGHLVCLAR